MLVKNLQFLLWLVAMLGLLNSGAAFVKVVPHFSYSFAANILVRDSIYFNSGRNLLISMNDNGIQYINKYSSMNGQLILLAQMQVSVFDPSLGPITRILAINSQTQLIAFNGVSYDIIVLDINSLSQVSSSFTFLNITQMLQSPVNKNIYIVDQTGNFGYLSPGSTAWSTNFLYTFSPGALRMSASSSFTYIAVSSISTQSILIFNIITNSYWDNKAISGLNTIAHEWLNDQILHVMPASSGMIYTYHATSKSLLGNNYIASGALNVFSIHMHTLSDTTTQYIIGSSMTIAPTQIVYTFYQLDFATLSAINSYTVTYNSSLVQIKYDTYSPQKAILIFPSFVDSINILQNCPLGQTYDPDLFACTLNVIVPSSNTTGSNTTNITYYSSYANITQLSTYQQQVLGDVISVAVSNSALKASNQVPGSRKVLQPVFMFFANFDDLQLYIYHQRNYNFVINSLFQAIQNLQSQKWSTIKFQVIWTLMGVNTTQIQSNFDSKYNYTSYKFVQIQGKSSGFMVNTLNLYLSNIFLISLMFFVMRALFFLLFDYEISKALREFSFWPYLYFMIIDGNLQFLTYMFVCEVQHFFNVNFSNKLGMVFMIFNFFVLIILVTCSHFLLRQTYGRLAKYFFDDTKVSISASIYLSLQFGYRNLLLGAIHASFNEQQTLKLSLLLTVQSLFLMNSLYYLSKKRFFRNSTRVAINILASILRIILIMTFFIDQKRQNQSYMTTLQIIVEQINLLAVQIYLSLALFSIFFQLIKVGVEIVKFAFRTKQAREIHMVQNLLQSNNKKMDIAIEEYVEQNIFGRNQQQIKISQKLKIRMMMNKEYQEDKEQKGHMEHKENKGTYSNKKNNQKIQPKDQQKTGLRRILQKKYNKEKNNRDVVLLMSNQSEDILPTLNQIRI